MPRHLLTIILCIFSLNACSQSTSINGPVPEKRRIEITQVLHDALKDKHITQHQHDDSLEWLKASPCKGVEYDLNPSRKNEFAQVVAKQLKYARVDVSELFQYSGWSIVRFDPDVSEGGYLFYSADPVTATKPVTIYSGGATVFETEEVRTWVLRNTPGVPDHLASCFAWHVTLNQ